MTLRRAECGYSELVLCQQICLPVIDVDGCPALGWCFPERGAYRPLTVCYVVTGISIWFEKKRSGL